MQPTGSTLANPLSFPCHTKYPHCLDGKTPVTLKRIELVQASKIYESISTGDPLRPKEYYKNKFYDYWVENDVKSKTYLCLGTTSPIESGGAP